MSFVEQQHLILTCGSWESFTSIDHNTWHTLFKRQSELLKNRACYELIKGMDELCICQNEIPKFPEINKILENKTGFSIIPVKGFIPENLFFKLLSERKFPSTCFIRKPDQIDYLQEPDIFHDIFGHIPLLVNPKFADFMEEFGHKGLKAIDYGFLKLAAALYWFTVEFGLINTKEGMRIYGAGIISSKSETLHSLDSNIPKRKKMDISRVFKTPYRIDCLQDVYFVIESFEELINIIKNIKWDNFMNKKNQHKGNHDDSR